MSWKITKGKREVVYSYEIELKSLIVRIIFEEELDIERMLLRGLELYVCNDDYCVKILDMEARSWKKVEERYVPYMLVNRKEIPEERWKLFFINFQELKRIVREYAEKRLKELEGKVDIFADVERMILNKLLLCLEITPTIIIDLPK